MTDYIKGTITELSPTQVIVENNGIGYVSEISLQTYSALEGKSEATVFIQQQINQRDGTTIDYGFASKSERNLFRLITAVSGMGASTARMILSTFTTDEFTEAVLSEDVNRLKSVKGLGVKGVQRLILELKDKLVRGDGDVPETLFVSSRNDIVDEATSALVMLGFSKPNISKAIQNILKIKPDAKVEEIIKSALQML